MAGTEPPAESVLRIVRGEPSPEEVAVLAALMAVVGSGGGAEPAPAPTRGRWNDPERSVRRPWTVGPGGWQAAR